MTSRDQRLAQTKYAGKKSASEAKKEREQSRSRVPDNAGGSVLDSLRAFDPSNPRPIERDNASIERARRHNDGLPPIGGN